MCFEWSWIVYELHVFWAYLWVAQWVHMDSILAVCLSGHVGPTLCTRATLWGFYWENTVDLVWSIAIRSMISVCICMSYMCKYEGMFYVDVKLHFLHAQYFTVGERMCSLALLCTVLNIIIHNTVILLKSPGHTRVLYQLVSMIYKRCSIHDCWSAMIFIEPLTNTYCT